MTKASRILTLAVLAVVITGCSPPWRVIRQSSPSALAGASQVAIAFDYQGLVVEGYPVNQWVDLRRAEDPQYTTTWNDLMGRYEQAVVDGLRSVYPGVQRASADSQGVIIWVQPQSFEMGKYMYVTATPTMMTSRVVYMVGGQPADEILVRHGVGASMVMPSVFQHISPVGLEQGATVGEYLRSRQ